MTCRQLIIGRWLIPACAALILLPSTVHAAHRIDCAVLLPVVDKLHADLQGFEQLASQRWFPQHEFAYMQLMTKKACRLVDGVRNHAPYGQVRADYIVLGTFVRSVDQRLTGHRAAECDLQLMRLWNEITCDFESAACLINGCSRSCRHHRPGYFVPHVVPQVVPPSEAIEAVPHRGPVGHVIPPRTSPLRHSGRPASPMGGPPAELRLQRRGTPDSSPPWLKILFAALSD